jgi:hypothetical protein
MASQAIQTIIGRAVLEPEFRALLQRDPAAAVTEYHLSDDERATLLAIKPEDFDRLAGDLEKRLSRSVLGAVETATKRESLQGQ